MRLLSVSNLIALVLLVGCGGTVTPPAPAPVMEYSLAGKKDCNGKPCIELRGVLKPGTTLTAGESRAAFRASVDLLESK